MARPEQTRIVVVVQARTGSSRLPGKVLLPLAGRPLLVRMVERVRAASTPFQLVVATTTESSDNAIVELCAAHDIACFRGHPTDLLDRHLQAAQGAQADLVVKIPSDCPLIDPRVIDRVLEFFLAVPDRYDYAGNLHPPTWPDGNDVEVMTMSALTEAGRRATRQWEREHTTPFLWERPDEFRIGNVSWDRDYAMSHRWTIDYPEDYEFIRQVFEALHRPDEPPFSVETILALLERRPELARINAQWAGVNWYRHHIDELQTVDARWTRRANDDRSSSSAE